MNLHLLVEKQLKRYVTKHLMCISVSAVTLKSTLTVIIVPTSNSKLEAMQLKIEIPKKYIA